MSTITATTELPPPVALDAAAVTYPTGTVGPFTLTLPDGPGVTAITGPTHSGKSTAVGLLLGIEEPTSGRVSIADPTTTRVVAYAQSFPGEPGDGLPEATSSVPADVSIVVVDDYRHGMTMHGLFCSEVPLVEKMLASDTRVVSATHDRKVAALADQQLRLRRPEYGRPARSPAATFAPIVLNGGYALAMHPFAVRLARSMGMRPAPVLVPVATWRTLYRSVWLT